MIVNHNTLDDFQAEIGSTSERLHSRTVRAAIDRTPLQVEAITFGVTFTATAMVVDDEEGCYLTRFSQVTGRDDSDTQDGTTAAESLRKTLEDFCDNCGLVVLPGEIEL